VTWAQRSSSSDPERNYVYLTIVAADVPESDLKLELKDQSLSFKGTSTSKKVTYAVDLELYAEIDPKESKINHSGRDVSLVLRKKELKEEFWPRLLKDSKKVHFLKTDFDKASFNQWVDEDEQDEAPEDDYMNQMNPMGGAGGGGDGGFGGIDFSKLGAAGGAGGLPGMGGMDLSSMGMGMDGGESSDDDDEMPELENDEESKEKAPEAAAPASASTDKPKIEEVA
ncbi:HSP20-like chaperone, partial [Pyrenochaeta sp. MPI-SDFR-AT-0127]